MRQKGPTSPGQLEADHSLAKARFSPESNNLAVVQELESSNADQLLQKKKQTNLKPLWKSL
jgi:hypothetical protein